jgi:hypothetical protein
MNLGQQDSVTHLVPAFIRLSNLESMLIDDDLAEAVNYILATVTIWRCQW